jgi:hypothetical protein
METLEFAWKGREVVDEDVEIELVSAFAKKRHLVDWDLLHV